MNMKTWKHEAPHWKGRRPDVDPSLAPRGPWDDEPDKAQWIDEATGLDCLIVRNPIGALCGYVGVPENHPWHGKDYSDCLRPDCDSDDSWSHYDHSPGAGVDVHGGLTFAAACHPSEEGESHGICHVPEPGRPDNVWWFGFDCAHAYDLAPGMVMSDRAMGWASSGEDIYRTFAYVQRECADLAQQLAAITAGDRPQPADA
jgi:hypothetical protein